MMKNLKVLTCYFFVGILFSNISISNVLAACCCEGFCVCEYGWIFIEPGERNITPCDGEYYCEVQCPKAGMGDVEVPAVHCEECFNEPECFAETVYGKHSKEAELMRSFRDNVLSQTLEGKELMRLYYELSPVIVEVMEADEGFKEDMKGMIDGALGLIVEETE